MKNWLRNNYAATHSSFLVLHSSFYKWSTVELSLMPLEPLMRMV